MSEAIAEKVKKLLRLAGCKAATPAEAANALNRALELIERHNLDIANLDLNEESERIVCENIKVGQRVSLIKRLVTGVLLRHFNVECIFLREELAVVGFENDVHMAGYVFHFLVGACNRSVNQYAKEERRARRKPTVGKKKNYIQGWIYGVTTNIRKPDLSDKTLDDSRVALVLSARKERVKAHFEELYPPHNQRTVKVEKPRYNHDAIVRGRIDGKSTSIHQPLDGAQKSTLLLT